jgi:4-amino-4-deoxy-L-arabinose transferase-like glycosyltransferase
MTAPSLSPDIPVLASTPSRLTHGRALLILALYALPILLIQLGTGDANDMMELFNLVPVKEAFRDHHWLIPTLNGLPRLQKPPLPVWLPAAFASLFHADTSFIMRFPSVLMALLTCFATYAIAAVTSRDRRTPLVAGILLASMILFVRQGRLASYDIFATAFTTLGLLGLLQMVIASSHRTAWAVFAGVALALANLSKGPVPPASVCVPFGLWMILFHRRDKHLWPRLLLAFIVCVLVSAPWFIAIELRLPGAHKIWIGEFLQYSSATGEEYQTSKAYYLGMLGWVAPWTPLLIGGLILPFMKADKEYAIPVATRRLRWLFWMILVLGLGLLTLATEKKPRYTLQQFPYAALLCAAVWEEFAAVTSAVRLNAGAKILLGAQTIVFFAIALGIPLAMIFAYSPATWSHVLTILPNHVAQHLQDIPAIFRTAFEYLTLPVAIAFSFGILLAAIMASQFIRQLRFMPAFGCLATAAFLFLFSFNWVYRGVNDFHASRVRPLAQQMIAAAYGHPIYALDTYIPWLEVLYYSDRILPEKSAAELTTLARENQTLFILLPAIASKPGDTTAITALAQLKDIAAASGRIPSPAFTFSDGHYVLMLYRLDAPAATGPSAVPTP